MNIHNHIILNISIIFLIKILNFLNFLSKKDWIFLFLGSITTCLLPDIDHPYSFLGRKVKFLSKFIYNNFGHRGITHSLFMLIILNKLFKIMILNIIKIFPISTYYGMSIGYLNHILSDMCTIRGVSLFWPINKKIKFPIIDYFKNLNKFKIIIILILLYKILKLI